jgi:hypothetical protein
VSAATRRARDAQSPQRRDRRERMRGARSRTRCHMQADGGPVRVRTVPPRRSDHYGAVVSSVVEESAAHVAGLVAGLTVVAVDEKLCMGGAREANKMIAAGIAKKGSASLVCHLPKQEGEHV